MINYKVLEPWIGGMATDMLANGQKIKEMVKVVFIGRMVINMKVIGQATEVTEKVYWHTPMVINFMGTGVKASWMAKLDYRKSLAKLLSAFGKTTKKLMRQISDFLYH